MIRLAVRSALTLVLVVSALAGVAGPAQAQSTAAPYTAAIRYDALGRVTGTIAPDPDGAGALRHLAVRSTYDPAGRLVKVEQGELAAWQAESVVPAGWSGFTVHRTEQTAYDSQGRKLREWAWGPTGGVQMLTQFSYDNRGRLECSAVRMNPAVYGALPASACDQSATGPQGQDRITRHLYDAAGQLLQLREGVGGSDAAGVSIESAEVSYSYTSTGKRRFVIDANGNRAEYRYDGHDRLVRWVLPAFTGPAAFNDASPASAVASAGAVNEADYERYEYDANGNRTLLRKRDGSELTYEYDALNRMTRKVVPDGNGLTAAQTQDVHYSYDARGLQTSARFSSAGGEGLLSHYDGFGRLQSAAMTLGGTSRTLAYEYDAIGNRTRITHPDEVAFGYSYDSLNRLSQLTYHNSADGANGAVLHRHWYYPDGSLASTGRVSVQANYNYDPIGRLATVKLFHSVNGGSFNSLTRWWYSYNPASQLTAITRNNDAFAFTAHANVDRAYQTNGLNQYTAAGPASFCHDANGNLTADGTSVYKYDVENRLVERRVQRISAAQANTTCTALSYAGDLQASLSYDPMGRLWQSTSGTTGITTTYLYDGDALTLEYGDAGSVLRRYVHGSNAGADDPLFWFEGNAPAWTAQRQLVADHQGSVVATVLADGTLQKVYAYDEYGVPQCPFENDKPNCTHLATGKDRFGYTGQIWLPELGMWYYKARVYSPTLGRFLQVDPIGYEDQTNLYAYVGNDPVNRVDTTGLRSDLATIRATEEAATRAAERAAAAKAARAAATVAARATPLSATIALGCDSPPCNKRVYATYTKTNPNTGQVYSGRTSIVVSGNTSNREAGLAAIAQRDSRHHIEGYGPAVLDRVSTSGNAIRGREQQLIDFNGGARSVGGTSGNAINGIWDYNPLRPLYMWESNREFGQLPSNRPGE